jgi:two-component system, OmpR family, response regulator
MKVLVVEDDKKIATALKRGLEGEGYSVDIAFDGIDGEWMATEYAFDVIVLDLMLPGRNGYKVCERLREAGNWTPILVLTAKDGEYDQTDALDCGADDFLSKPFSFAVLNARLRALLRRTTGATPAPMSVGDLRIEPGPRRCFRGTTEIVLTAREFAVLEFLVRRAGTVVSKRDILDGVWSHDFDGDMNIVEVYLRRLRKKVDEPFGCASFETVRGAGYRVGEGT